MNTREIVDAINIDTKEKVYFKGHAKATYMSNGRTVEDTMKNIYVKPEDGVYVVDLEGKLHNPDQWEGGSDATGVALINSRVSIVIAPDEWYSPDYDENDNEINVPWNGNNYSAWSEIELVTNCTSIPSIQSTYVTSPESDFNGFANTKAIVTQLQGLSYNHDDLFKGAPAAEYCYAYSKGNKKAGQWYLPAAGELYEIAIKVDEINKALNCISGKPLNTKYLTTSSTQTGAECAWGYIWPENCLHKWQKYASAAVRPITNYKPSTEYVADTDLLNKEVADLTYQKLLISGTNIKTINGTSILGSGDITIEVGDAEDAYQPDGYCIDLWDGEWDSDSESWIKEYNKLYEAFNQGVRTYFIRYQYNSQSPNLIPCEVSFNNFTYDRFNISFVVSDNYYTGCMRSIGLVFHSNGSVEVNGSLLVDVYGEGEKFLADDGTYKEIEALNIPVVNHGTGNTSFILTPNAYHQWGTVSNLTLTLQKPEEGKYCEYMFQFASGANPTSLTLPDTIKWVSEPSVEANKIYQCSIVNNIGVIAAVDNQSL